MTSSNPSSTALSPANCRMSPVPSFPASQVEALSKVLGDCGSGSEISRIFVERGLQDYSGESTKWRRLDSVFLDCQRKNGSANGILAFIETFVSPLRFVGRADDFERNRRDLNTVLVFSGLEFGADGKFRRCPAAVTLDEAEARVQTIRAKFQSRRIHPEVFKYCRRELFESDYFHAVFEATKGLAQRIRDRSGIQKDGASLVDAVFSIDRPLLAFNTLQTESERSEHKGFAQLLKGCFAAVRNPLAHEPRILWQGEEDAADFFSMISLLHRRLDDCVATTPCAANS